MIEVDDQEAIGDSALVARLAKNSDGVLERIAEESGVSTFQVVCALPGEQSAVATGSDFVTVMADISTWGDVLLIVHTSGIVLECKGPIPPGSFGRGYFNIHGDSPIGGHIKADRCLHIAFVSRPFMGRPSCSIQFFDGQGDAIFKVFVRRNKEGALIAKQREQFHNLRERLCG